MCISKWLAVSVLGCLALPQTAAFYKTRKRYKQNIISKSRNSASTWMSKVCWKALKMKIVPPNPCSWMKIPSEVGNPFQRLRHTSIDTSVRQFVGDKLIVQLLDLGCQGLREKSGIDLFGDVGGTVAEQSADNSHGQAVVDGKNRECMPRGMKR